MATHADGPTALDRAMHTYARAEAARGDGAEAEAPRVAAGLGLPDRVLGEPVGALSGGQRRRVELARILFRRTRRRPAAGRADQSPRPRLP